MLSSGFPSLLEIFNVLVTVLLLTFLTKLYGARRRMVELRRKGLAMPPYSLLWGHLLVVKNAMSTLPSDARGNYIPRQVIASTPGLGPMFYLDLWPFGPQMLVVASPDGLYQITQEHSLPKFHALRNFLRPMTGKFDLVTMEGEMWRTWRNIFNPAFSPGHLMKFVPAIVEETTTFCKILQEHAEKSDIVPLKMLTDNLTMDVIGRVVLDCQLNSQRSRNVLAAALRRQIPWCSFGAESNPFDRFNPLRPFVHWYNTRQMNNYLSHELEDRFANPEFTQKSDQPEQGRSVIDVAIKAGLSNAPEKRNDAAFKSFMMSQVKLFLFAGHDTTSSTISYVTYLLSCHPAALDRVRAEHDTVFGRDLDQTSSIISEKPHLLNQLPFTVAVIKETLRLFPPSSSTRAGEPGFSVTSSDGLEYPTEGFLVWSSHDAIHHDPTYWPDTASFIPDRWLVQPDDPLYPIKGAWRPFEFGPRNCIGQELTMKEVKVVMVMTLRQFTITPAYEELDRQRTRTGPTTVDGERAYTVGIGEPVEKLPCRIERIQK